MHKQLRIGAKALAIRRILLPFGTIFGRYEMATTITTQSYHSQSLSLQPQGVSLLAAIKAVQSQIA